MLSTRAIENYLERIQPDLQELIWELRNLIASAAPAASEVTHRNGLIYFDPARGGHVSAGICQILVHPDHLRLAFIHGAFLPDPEHLLQGDEKYKRYVRLDSYENAPWEALKELITASASFDPRQITVQDIAALQG